MNDIQYSLKSIEQKITLLKKIKEFLKTLPSDFPGDVWESCESVCISVPYDPKKIAIVRRMLGDGFKVSHRAKTMDDGDWVINYCRKDDPLFTVSLFGRIQAEGATCRRVKVGVRATPIYKIVCDADAALQLGATDTEPTPARIAYDRAWRQEEQYASM